MRVSGAMNHSPSRAGFLRGRFRDQDRPIRPPWAVDEAAFATACDACGDCLRACPEGIIARGAGGLPEVDFSCGGCDFCGQCLEVCPTGALADRGQAPWTHKAIVISHCFSWQGVVCRLCEDRCAQDAIHFKPALGGYTLPEIDSEACNGCGACVAACPTQAIAIKPVAP